MKSMCHGFMPQFIEQTKTSCNKGILFLSMLMFTICSLWWWLSSHCSVDLRPMNLQYASIY